MMVCCAGVGGGEALEKLQIFLHERENAVMEWGTAEKGSSSAVDASFLGTIEGHALHTDSSRRRGSHR